MIIGLPLKVSLGRRNVLCNVQYLIRVVVDRNIHDVVIIKEVGKFVPQVLYINLID